MKRALRAHPIFVFLKCGETLEETIARKKAAGEIPKNARVRGIENWRSRRGETGLTVVPFRWLTEEEAIARGMEQPPDPPAPQPYTPPQLQAPPELKLLPAPSPTSAKPPGAEESDDPYELRRAVPPQPRKPEDKFHWPIIYPRTGEGV